MIPAPIALSAAVGPGPRKISRRTLMASAAAAVALGACARPDHLMVAFGVATPLRIHIVGIPARQAEDLVAALKACEDAYAKAHRGRVAVQVTMNLVPEPAWYRMYCPPPPTKPCPPAAYPASPAQANSMEVAVGDSAAFSQIGQNGVPLWLARGRTRLDVKFGDSGLLPPVLTSLETAWPDIILGYDIWQYWLAPLGADLTAQWKTTSDDRDGLPANVDRYGRFFAPDRGTFVAAFPLLRDPMMLVNVDPVTPWTWAQVISTLGGPPSPRAGATWDTTRLRQSSLYPDATEWAAAMVVGSGGQLATMTAGSPPVAAFTSAPVQSGVNAVAQVIAAGPPPSLENVSSGNYYPVSLKHMFTVLGGTREGYFIGGSPWPAGTVRTAVPCTYFCATVVSLGQRLPIAQDFASFLMHPAAQAVLARWNGGFALRADQALPKVPVLFPHIPGDLAESLVSGANDLTTSDLYGGEKTVENGDTYDAIADQFAGAFAAIPPAGTDPAKIAAILAQAAHG